MRQYRHRHVAAVDDTPDDLRRQAVAQMPAAIQRQQCAGIAVEPWKPPRHLDERGKIIRVARPALRPAMRRDHRYATFQRQGEHARRSGARAGRGSLAR